MLKNLFVILRELIVAFSVLVTINHCTPGTEFERQLKLTNEYLKTSDTKLIKESQKNTINTMNDTLFWTLSDMENATEIVLPEIDVHNTQGIQNEIPEVKSSIISTEKFKEHSNSNMFAIVKPAINAEESTRQKINSESFPQKLYVSFQVNEKIILPRNNCHVEIAIHENRDTKLTIMFERLQNNSYGICCLTLSGHENSKLGVVISNINLYWNNTQGEVLKVVVGNHNAAFFLKEYYGSKEYGPLLLTETNKVYLVLYYKVEYIAPSEDCTKFNLEVFTYQKNENSIYHYKEHEDNYNHRDAVHANHTYDIYSSKEMPYFTPYIYNRTH